MRGAQGARHAAGGQGRHPKGRCASGRAGGGHHGREANAGPDPSNPSAPAHQRERRLRIRARRCARAGTGSCDRSDRRRDGGADGRRGRGADPDRYDEGRRKGRVPGDGPSAREVGRAVRHLEARCKARGHPPALRATSPASGEEMGSAQVITVSDGVSAGTREDESGKALVRILKDAGFDVMEPVVVLDEQQHIADAIVTAADRGADVVVTTGGTGLGPRDVTPQATSAVIDFEVPGIGEAMRRAGAASTPMAALSRSMAGVRGQTLIINVPGSPTGATESLEAVMPTLAHAIKLLHGDTKHG